MTDTKRIDRLKAAVPTVTLVVPRTVTPHLARSEWQQRLDNPRTRPSMIHGEIYVVRFKEKHDRGIGVPGERWDFLHENPMDAALRCAAEELGLKITGEQLFPFTTRARCGRDVRTTKPRSVDKYMHVERDELSDRIAGLPDDIIEMHHIVDVVILAVGVNADPSSLVPSDPVEVEGIELLTTTGEIPKLPISDDAELIHRFERWRSRGESMPALLQM